MDAEIDGKRWNHMKKWKVIKIDENRLKYIKIDGYR